MAQRHIDEGRKETGGGGPQGWGLGVAVNECGGEGVRGAIWVWLGVPRSCVKGRGEHLLNDRPLVSPETNLHTKKSNCCGRGGGNGDQSREHPPCHKPTACTVRLT